MNNNGKTDVGMILKIVFIIVMLSVVVSTFSQNMPVLVGGKPVLIGGSVLYWPGDAGGGGGPVVSYTNDAVAFYSFDFEAQSFNDCSSNSNNLWWGGAPAFVNVQTGYYLNGASYGRSANLFGRNTNTLPAMTWAVAFRADSAAYSFLLSKNSDDSKNRFYVGIDADATFFWDTEQNDVLYDSMNSTNIMLSNVWYVAAGTWGPTYGKLMCLGTGGSSWLDGQHAAETTLMRRSLTGDFTFGAIAVTHSSPFTGDVKLLFVWEGEATSNQLLTICATPYANITTNTIAVPDMVFCNTMTQDESYVIDDSGHGEVSYLAAGAARLLYQPTGSGGYYRSDGTDYMTNDTTFFTNANKATIAFGFRLQELADAGYDYFLGQRSSVTNSWWISNVSGTNTELEVQFCNNGVQCRVVTTNANITSNVWYHVRASYDGTVPDVKIHIDDTEYNVVTNGTVPATMPHLLGPSDIFRLPTSSGGIIHGDMKYIWYLTNTLSIQQGTEMYNAFTNSL